MRTRGRGEAGAEQNDTAWKTHLITNDENQRLYFVSGLREGQTCFCSFTANR